MRLPGLDYKSPKTFSAAQRLQLALIPPVAAGLLRGIFASNRLEYRNAEHRWRMVEEHGCALVAFWHETLALAGCAHAGSNGHTLTSFSFDGELVAQAIRWIGLEAVRGSSSKGGSHALQQLEKAVAAVPLVGITLDGPRGPRRHAKPGTAILSYRTQVPVIPLALACTRNWRLRSWDRFCIPKPFGRVICAYAPPIGPPESGDPGEITAKTAEIEQAVGRLQTEVEEAAGDVQDVRKEAD